MQPYKFNCNRFLLPNYFKSIGMGIILLAAVLWILKISHLVESDFSVRYVLALGLLAYAAAREKDDDEMIEKIRLTSFHVALLRSVLGVLIIDAFFFIEGSANVTGAIEFITIQLIAYIIWFMYEMSKMKASIKPGI